MPDFEQLQSRIRHELYHEAHRLIAPASAVKVAGELAIGASGYIAEWKAARGSVSRFNDYMNGGQQFAEYFPQDSPRLDKFVHAINRKYRKLDIDIAPPEVEEYKHVQLNGGSMLLTIDRINPQFEDAPEVPAGYFYRTTHVKTSS